MQEQGISKPTTSDWKKFKMNLIIGVKVWVSPQPISALTTQTALTDWKKIIHRSPPPSQKVWGKKQKQPLRWLSTNQKEQLDKKLFITIVGQPTEY